MEAHYPSGTASQPPIAGGLSLFNGAVRLSAHRGLAGLIWFGFVVVSLWFLAGCATSPTALNRPFQFDQDTFAFENELVWEYSYDAQGRWKGRPRDPKPEYAQHCFPVVRAVRQFWYHAQFEAAEPKESSEEYRKMIRQVVSRNPRKPSAAEKRILIPGYADLRTFSIDHEAVLKAECGGAWESSFQRGHWRMIFPFSRKHQADTAAAILADLQLNRPPILHLATFPALTINHAIMVYGAHEEQDSIRFDTYDPNEPQAPVTLVFDRQTRTFSWPVLDYFPGGPVDVYRVYYRWNY